MQNITQALNYVSNGGNWMQISFSGVVFPALIATYCGQAAYLVKFPENVGNTFYASIPGKSTLNTSEAVHILCIVAYPFFSYIY